MTLDIDEIADADECRPRDMIPALVREVHRTFSRRLQDVLSAHEVGIGHWLILLALWEEDGLTQRQLSRRVGTMEPTTVTALNALEARGFVQRVRNPRDRRKVNVHLTPKGWTARDVLVPLVNGVRAQALRGVPAETAEVVVETLSRVVDNLRHGDDGLYDTMND